jgi:hypothetical protein
MTDTEVVPGVLDTEAPNVGRGTSNVIWAEAS